MHVDDNKIFIGYKWLGAPPILQISRVLTTEKEEQSRKLIPKSLERSPAVGDFYGTGIEIWAGFGPVRQLLRPVFSCFHGQIFFSKNIVDGENIFGIE